MEIDLIEYMDKREKLIFRKDEVATNMGGDLIDANDDIYLGSLKSNVIEGYAYNYKSIKRIIGKYVELLEKDIQIMQLTKEEFEEAENRNLEILAKSETDLNAKK